MKLINVDINYPIDCFRINTFKYFQNKVLRNPFHYTFFKKLNNKIVVQNKSIFNHTKSYLIHFNLDMIGWL